MNKKILIKENLFYNLSKFSNKKICAMVKANAYGHGIKEIVGLLKEKVDIFGVVNIDEAKRIRKITNKDILICSKVDDLQICKENDFGVMIESENDLEKCIEVGLSENIYLKINCGMNRFGCKSESELEKINNILTDNHIKLKSIYTHFSNTENKDVTLSQYQTFQSLCKRICQNPPICFGGSGISCYDLDFDILRLGISLYGYGNPTLKPVMKITSHVSKIFYINSGEFVGYGTFGKIETPSYIAIVPLGYGDGLRRNLSGLFSVKINNKYYKSIGLICMDCFFVEVDNTVRVGDDVVVLDDAENFSSLLTTIPYEILTGFSSARAKTVII